MKKCTSILISLLLLGAAACTKQPASPVVQPDGGSKTPEAAVDVTEAPADEITLGEGDVSLEELDDPGMLLGGWTVDPVGDDRLPEDVQSAFDRVTEKLLGVNYTPVAFLGSQVVAGVNYAILCEAKPVVPDPVQSLKVMIIYVDLSGEAELLEISDLDLGAYAEKEELDVAAEMLMGGWQAPEEAEPCDNLPTDALAALEQALEGFVGNSLVPVAYLGSQVVAGTNYAFLCHSTLVTEDPVTSMQLVFVYADLAGNASISNIVTLNPADFN